MRVQILASVDWFLSLIWWVHSHHLLGYFFFLPPYPFFFWYSNFTLIRPFDIVPRDFTAMLWFFSFPFSFLYFNRYLYWLILLFAVSRLLLSPSNEFFISISYFKISNFFFIISTSLLKSPRCSHIFCTLFIIVILKWSLKHLGRVLGLLLLNFPLWTVSHAFLHFLIIFIGC